jgi:sugar lactone lactonase YvrE
VAAARAATLLLALGAAACPMRGPEDCPSGKVCTVAGTGEVAFDEGEGTAALHAPVTYPLDLLFGPDGDGYLLDSFNARIRRWDLGADAVTTIAGTGVTSFGPPGPALEAGLNFPAGLAFDSAGRLLVAGFHNCAILRVDLETGLLDVVAGIGARAFSGDGGAATAAAFSLPSSIAFDAAGTLYISDGGNNRIRRVDANGIVDTVVGTGAGGEGAVDPVSGDPAQCIGYLGPYATAECFVDGDLAVATLNGLNGTTAMSSERIAFDAAGLLYIADTMNNAIRRVDFAASTMTTIAGLGPLERGYSGDGGPALSAQLNRPADLEVAPDGTLYVADTGNHCIRAIRPDGIIETVAGVCGVEGDAEPRADRLSAHFQEPYGIALGLTGDLYVSDTSNSVIRVVRLGAE